LCPRVSSQPDRARNRSSLARHAPGGFVRWSSGPQGVWGAMKSICEVCEAAPAVVVCCEDDACMCQSCDANVHGANVLAQKHTRLPLQAGTGTEVQHPQCDICQASRGVFFCCVDRALLCRKCDYAIHTANDEARTHPRFLLGRIPVALDPAAPAADPVAGNKRKSGTANKRVAAVALKSATAATKSAAKVEDELLGLSDMGDLLTFDAGNDFGAFLKDHDLALVPDISREIIPRVPSFGELEVSSFAKADGAAQDAKSGGTSDSDGVVPDLGKRARVMARA